MVARGPGAVGCAHCTRLGATASCEVCGHLVCPACAADWSTCALPSGKVLRLGRGARLFEVDPAGRLGLVSTWTGGLKIVDLRALRWSSPSTSSFESRRTFATSSDVRPRLTADGRLIRPELSEAIG